MITNWEDIVDKDFPPLKEVTEKEQRAAFKQGRDFAGSLPVRFILGRIPTSEEIRDRRINAYKKPLF